MLRHDKHDIIYMKFVRLSLLALLSVSFTSCSQTWAAFKNTFPVKFLDEAGATMMRQFTENNLPVNGKPASMQERARQVQGRGIYAGGSPAVMGAAGQRMAAR